MPKKLEESTYLKRLKFKPELANNLFAKYIRNTRLIILMIITIIIFGAYSYSNLPRNINPDVNIPYVIVSTVLPGAGPNDVESLVTIPLEDSIKSIQNIKTLQSTSNNSVSVIIVEFDTGVDTQKAKTDVKSAVDAVTNLPSDAQTPNVQTIDLENQPIWSFDIVGSGNSASLISFSNQLKNTIESLSSVDKVVISGLEEQEIQILIKPEIISSYNLNPQTVISAITSSLKSMPVGSVSTTNSNYTLTIDPAIITVNDIRSTKINLNNNVLNISDIAVVSQRSKPEQSPSYIATAKTNALRAISFDVYRAKTSRIDQTIKDAKDAVDKSLAGTQFKIYSVLDIGKMLDDQFHDLQRDFTLTIILVATILFIFLGFRQAAVSSVAIPLTFLITFTVMNLTGVALSFISTFSLLLSLGLLVDDTIVVVSAMTAYYRSGKFTPFQTGLLVWKDFLTPVLTTTTTTVWAFLPLLISTGIIGEFIKPIPIVVSSTLVASIFIALFVTLPFIIVLLKPDIPSRVVILFRILLLIIIILLFYLLVPKSTIILIQLLVFFLFLFITYQVRFYLFEKIAILNKNELINKFNKKVFNYFDNGVISFQVLSNNYKKLIHRILISKNARRQTVLMVVIFSVFSYLLFPLGFVKNEFFPKTNEDYLYVSVEYPAGTNLETVNTNTLNLLKELKGTPGIQFVIADIAKSSSTFTGSTQGDVNSVQYTLELDDPNIRKLQSFDIAKILRDKYSNYQIGKLSVQEVSGGPPSGSDLQIKLFGPDLTILDSYANKLEDYLSKQQGVTNVDKSIKPGTSKLVFVPDNQKLADYNITLDQIGFWLRLYASGITANTIKLPEDNNQKKDISIRLNSQTQKVEDISSIMIPNQGNSLPISSLGTFKIDPNPTLITRENSKRTISVTASVISGYSIATINKALEKQADSLNLPTDYSWQTGGVNEQNQQSITSTLQAMLISFVLIIITMVIQFASFRKALIVMLVIPLSISGVFIIFALTQTYLSYPALIGVLALFGIVVKNSILLVDKIIINQHSGMEFTESISDAASSRLEAIALTSIATITGLIPITLSNPLWRGLGGAIISGLAFSGTIMLFFIPVVYYLIFQGSEGKGLIKMRR